MFVTKVIPSDLMGLQKVFVTILLNVVIIPK